MANYYYNNILPLQNNFNEAIEYIHKYVNNNLKPLKKLIETNCSGGDFNNVINDIDLLMYTWDVYFVDSIKYKLGQIQSRAIKNDNFFEELVTHKGEKTSKVINKKNSIEELEDGSRISAEYTEEKETVIEDIYINEETGHIETVERVYSVYKKNGKEYSRFCDEEINSVYPILN